MPTQLRRCLHSRTSSHLLLGFITLLVTLWLTPSIAIGPTLPLRFDEAALSKDPWKAVLTLEPEQIRLTRIERQIYANGEMLHREPIEAKFERFYLRNERESMRAVLPLDSDALRKTRDKATIAQKIVVEGEWLKEEGAKPLYLQRWYYFTWKGDRLRPISIDEYTRLTDLPEHERTGDDRTRSVFRGRDLKTEVPLPETKGSPALPAGSALEEQPVRDDKTPTTQMRREERSDRIDRSEINEK